MKKVFMILITIGVVMLFGTAGASDVGNITVGRACMQGLASIGFLFSGMLGMLLCRLEEIRLRRTVAVRNCGVVLLCKEQTFIPQNQKNHLDFKDLPNFDFNFYIFSWEFVKFIKCC